MHKVLDECKVSREGLFGGGAPHPTCSFGFAAPPPRATQKETRSVELEVIQTDEWLAIAIDHRKDLREAKLEKQKEEERRVESGMDL